MLAQMESFAREHGLVLHGIKEVWDNYRNSNPIQLVKEYESRLDLIIVLFRNPKKQWSSMFHLGHTKHFSFSEFSDKYTEFYNLLGGKYVQFIYKEFIKDPENYARLATGLDIPDQVKLEQYSGGGDAIALHEKKIWTEDTRIPYAGKELDSVMEIYQSLL